MAKKIGQLRKKIDKSKTQLRKKKLRLRLPKGGNDTFVDVKKKRIVVPCQLTERDSTQILTKKKLSYADLFSRLHHHSLSNRLNGLEGLKELLHLNEKTAIDYYLGDLFNNLLPLSCDSERRVRMLSADLLHIILSLVSNNAYCIEPYFASFRAHLVRALTHIDRRVKQDALVLLDALLEYVPLFIASSYAQILSICTDQIIAGSSNVKISSKMVVAKLDNSINDNVTSLTWRTHVLRRILKTFRAMLIFKNRGEFCVNEVKSCHFSSSDSAFYAAFFSSNSTSSLSLIGMEELWRSESWRNLGSSEVSMTNSTSFNLKSYASLLTPLLLDTWSEATTTVTKSVKSILNVSDIPLFECIAECISLMLKLLKHESFVAQYLDQFADRFDFLTSNFPYSATIPFSKKKFHRQTNQSITCQTLIKLNLELANVFVIQFSEHFFERKTQDFKLVERILDYMRYYVSNDDEFNKHSNDFANVLKQIGRYIVIKKTCSQHIRLCYDQILKDMIQKFPTHPDTTGLLAELATVLQYPDDEFGVILQLESVQDWIAFLARKYLKSGCEGNVHYENAVRVLKKQGNETFVRILRQA